MPGLPTATKLDEIIENFNYLDEWEDRYRYLIELGRGLEPLDDAAHSDRNKVRGCASQVWLETRVATDHSGSPLLHLKGDSDAHIVRGLVALLCWLFIPARRHRGSLPLMPRACSRASAFRRI